MADNLCPQGVEPVQFVGVDKDEKMLAVARERLSGKEHIRLGQCAYDEWAKIDEIGGLSCFDYILLDIGINWGHIWDASRGFSIKGDGPLDMRFDARRESGSMTAEQYLHRMDVKDFAQKLEQYGDFSPARAEQISLHIARSKHDKPIKTTLDLVEVLKSIKLNGRKQAIIFQVLRIIVNDELGHLERFLESFGDHLTVGGRCAIMTFHSIEDRMVKQSFKKRAERDDFVLVNKKVIKPHRQEREKNKASRSAKLRIIEKIS